MTKKFDTRFDRVECVAMVYRPTPIGDGGQGQKDIGGQMQRWRFGGREQPSDVSVPINCCKSP